ncbi:hypothetical protein ABPG77_000471 [Micractinium sp. CCAP 211/92]
MWQPPQENAENSFASGLLQCLDCLARCLCCLGSNSFEREGGQRLLSTQGEPLTIEASASPSPRLPSASEHRPLLKGQAPSSSAQPAASPPMPPPFFPPPPRPKHRRGSSGSGSSPEGGSPKAGTAAASSKPARKGSRLHLGEEEEDICPTCLDPYTEDNPKVLTRCGHAFHLPCLYEWLERSETCPVCERPMQFEEIV